MIDAILVDMDGVFADYLTPSLRLFGFDIANYPVELFNVWEALGISQSDYVGTMDRQVDFWKEIQPYPWKDELVGALEETQVPWKIVSSPWIFQHPTLHSDKVDWVRRHIGRKVKVHLCDEKYLMASPRHLLIDDGEHNTVEFAARGGRTILFPQRWNSRHHLRDPFTTVKRELEEIIGRQEGSAK